MHLCTKIRINARITIHRKVFELFTVNIGEVAERGEHLDKGEAVLEAGFFYKWSAKYHNHRGHLIQ